LGKLIFFPHFFRALLWVYVCSTHEKITCNRYFAVCICNKNLKINTLHLSSSFHPRCFGSVSVLHMEKKKRHHPTHSITHFSAMSVVNSKEYKNVNVLHICVYIYIHSSTHINIWGKKKYIYEKAHAQLCFCQWRNSTMVKLYLADEIYVYLYIFYIHVHVCVF